MKKWVWVLPLLFLMVSCGPSTQSGVNKEYDVQITVRENSTATFIMGVEADTAAEALAGDAPASASTELPVSVALKGAQASASGDESTISGGKPINVEPIDASNRPVTNTTTPAPVPVPTQPPDNGGGSDPDVPGDGDNADSGFNPDDYEIIAEALCDDTMTFRDGSAGEDTEGTGVEQKKCVFDKAGTEYGKSFVVQWSSGNTLDVLDSSKMTWLAVNPDTGEKDYRKYHPQQPTEGGEYVDGTPAEVYAGRGDNSSKAYILGKKYRHHHTTTGSSDGGKSLVLCPDDPTIFDSCTADGVSIPYHGEDNGRVIFWNMTEVPEGPIICNKGDETYVFPADEPVQMGDCSKKVSADCGPDQPSDRQGYSCMQKVEWEGGIPDIEERKFSRCWWTDTTGEFAFLQRKFNFEDWDGWKDGDDVLVVFEGGPEVKVTRTNKRHYPSGAAGHVKWNVPKMEDGNPCKHHPSIAAPKDSSPDYAILYYN